MNCSSKGKDMTKNEKLICLISGLWTLGNTMSAVFVNVYLYAYTGSLVVMTIYCMIRIGLFPVFFSIGGKWAQRKGFSQTLIMGLIITMISLIYVLAANTSFETNPNLVYVVAALVGSGEGLFWLSVNSLNQIVSTENTRARYISNLGIFNNIANLIAPLFATVLIDLAPNDIEGYINIFKIVIVVYGFMSFAAFKVKANHSTKSFSILKNMRIRKDKRWRYCMTSTFLYGMRDSLILTLTGLLVYNATGGKGSLYSQLLTVFAIASIGAYYILAKKMNKGNLYFFYKIGAYLIASSTIILVIFPTMFGAIYYGIVNAIATPMYANPYQVIMMNNIQKYEKKENIVGRVIAKEIYLSAGRCFGMFCIVMCSMILPNKLYLPVSVIFCSLFPIILVYYAKRYELGNYDFDDESITEFNYIESN